MRPSRRESPPFEQLGHRVIVFGSDVEKGADSFRAKEESAAVRVRFDEVVESGVGQHRLEPQGFFELSGDVNQPQLLAGEVLSVSSHDTEVSERLASLSAPI